MAARQTDMFEAALSIGSISMTVVFILLVYEVPRAATLAEMTRASMRSSDDTCRDAARLLKTIAPRFRAQFLRMSVTLRHRDALEEAQLATIASRSSFIEQSTRRTRTELRTRKASMVANLDPSWRRPSWQKSSTLSVNVDGADEEDGATSHRPRPSQIFRAVRGSIAYRFREGSQSRSMGRLNNLISALQVRHSCRPLSQSALS